MDLIKKDNWVICLILTIITEGLFSLVLASLMKLYDKKAWYCNYKYWLFGALCLLFPVVIMFVVFLVQITCMVAKTLQVPGDEIYNSPYSWIICMVVPVIGWIMLIVMYLYIVIWPIVMIYNGKGESLNLKKN